MVIELVMMWTTAALAGGTTAAAYFGGLRWTVRRLHASPHPVRLVVGSFLIRAVCASAALVAVADGDPVRLLLALGGFVAVRQWTVHNTRAWLRPAPMGGA